MKKFIVIYTNPKGGQGRLDTETFANVRAQDEEAAKDKVVKKKFASFPAVPIIEEAMAAFRSNLTVVDNDVIDYIKSIQPKIEDHLDLIYGNEYHCWRGKKYLGILTWYRDEKVGDSFMVKKPGKDGSIEVEVYVVDRWTLVKPIVR